MPNITMKELGLINSFITKHLPVIFESIYDDFFKDNITLDEWCNDIHEYTEIKKIFDKLEEENKKIAEASKKRMRKLRADNPEHYKEYGRKYMQDYNKGKRRKVK